MFAKIFLVCFLSAVAFQGTQAKHVETFSMVGDMQDTVKELVHLYEEFMGAEKENLAHFFEEFGKLYQALEDQVTGDSQKLIESMKTLIEKMHGISQQICQAALDCLQGESGNAKEALENFRTAVIKIVNDAKDNEMKVFQQAKDTKCVKDILELAHCEGTLNCGSKGIQAVKDCKKDFEDKTFQNLVKQAVSIVADSIKAVTVEYEKLETSASASIHNVLECAQKKIMA